MNKTNLQTQDLEKYHQFAKNILETKFDDISILVTAFTHRSYLNEHKKTVSNHNERLEFLGDAVLELIVTDYLYTKHAEAEGILTNWRSALVRTESIGEAATINGYNELIRLSRGEKRGTDRARLQIMANCYEAVLGALYIDQGYDAAANYVNKSILSKLPKILETGSWMDAKSHLQEIAQSQAGATPVYKVLAEVGPDHEKIFEIGVFVAGELRGKGKGFSKQAAQQEAAEQARRSYNKKPPTQLAK